MDQLKKLTASPQPVTALSEASTAAAGPVIKPKPSKKPQAATIKKLTLKTVKPIAVKSKSKPFT